MRLELRARAERLRPEGVLHFKQNLQDANGISYELDGIVGYIFGRCEPEPDCIPEGAERVYRLYHPGRDDYAIFPESELLQWQAAGYISQGGVLTDWIGYSYVNVDSDGDFVIDGWERTIGTDPTRVDSDCDGLSDGVELLVYDMSGEPAEHGFGDPIIGPCGGIFSDGFEPGDASRWSAAQ